MMYPIEHKFEFTTHDDWLRHHRRRQHMADATQATSQTTQPPSTRKLTAGLFISLDGVTESPEQWQFDHFDEDMMAGLGMQIASEDIILLVVSHCRSDG